MPGPFSMADPSALRAGLVAAGFADVAVTSEQVPFVFDSVDQFVGFTRAVTPPGVLAKVTDHFGSPDHPRPWAAVGREVAPFADEAGRLTMPCTTILVRAVAPA
jgi:hypothetical protein